MLDVKQSECLSEYFKETTARVRSRQVVGGCGGAVEFTISIFLKKTSKNLEVSQAIARLVPLLDLPVPPAENDSNKPFA